MSQASNNRSRAQQGATRRNNKKIMPRELAHILMAPEELSQRQLTAIELVLRGLSDAQVAAQLGVDRGTVYRWRMSPLFRRELERQRKVLFEHSAARLSSMIEPALEILNRQLIGDDPKTALRAAAILLRVATPARLGQFAEDKKRGLGAEDEVDADDASESELGDDQWEAIKSFIDSPLPGEKSAAKNSPCDDDDDDLEEETNEDDDES
jgi:hypothetical protein